ncbi:MAG: transketolase family protein [Candidatus Caldatribacteriaceae bacterium]
MSDRRTALQEGLVRLIEEGKEIVCVSVDSASRFKKVRDRYPRRVVECGICEQAGMGICAGIALQGLTPVISGYATFLTMRAFEQIRTDICRWSLNVKICSTDTGFSAQYAGFTHQALEDIAILFALENIVICEPCDYEDTLLMVRYLLGEFQGPVYMRFGARGGEENFLEKHRDVQMGYFEPLSAETLSGSLDVVIIALGQLVGVGMEVVERLERRGYRAFLYNARFVKPLAVDMLQEMARATSLIVTLEEHSRVGGLGDALWRSFQEFGRVPGLLKFGALSNFGFSGKRAALLQKCGLHAQHIEDVIARTLEGLDAEKTAPFLP